MTVAQKYNVCVPLLLEVAAAFLKYASSFVIAALQPATIFETFQILTFCRFINLGIDASTVLEVGYSPSITIPIMYVFTG
jgi:hypothetical protein